jgi:hypothetical protein
MVRRQTRVQKRNRRQKTKRNNRRQNKTLRRKRQSRRKGGSGHNVNEENKFFHEFEAKNLGLSYEKFKELSNKAMKENKTIYQKEAEKWEIDENTYLSAIDEAKLLGQSLDDYIKDYIKNKKSKSLFSFGIGNNYKKLEAKLLGINIDKYKDLEKEVKKIKTVDHLMAYKLGMDVGKYRDIIKTQANFTGLPVDEIFKVYEEAIREENEEHVILEKMDSIIAKKLGFKNDIKNYKNYCQYALNSGSSVIQLIREDPISPN